MKGLNVKKIAALAAGALFLGSAAVTAGLTYHDTELISDSGVPQVSVVVGENAAASDGVAAARIASFLASKAYKTTHYTADVTGEGQCTSTGGEEGGTTTGQCTDMSVTLKITSPGITGAYEITTNIYDVFDRDMRDRDDSNAGSYNDAWDGADDEDDTSPFFESSGSGDEFLAARVDSDFTPFKDYSFNVAGMDFSEKQYAYIEGITQIEDDGEPYASVDQIVYSAKFYWDKDNGIPVCIKEENDNWAYCLGDAYGDHDAVSDKEMARKRPKINLFNSDWYIIDMHPPDIDSGFSLDNEDDRLTGGDITLAKESAYGILQIGESLETGDYKVTLDDIATATGSDNEHPAIVSVYDKNTGELLVQDQIFPGTDNDLDVGGGNTITVHVYQTAPGYTLSQKWAEMAVFDKKWKLSDGDEIDDNDHWYVHLYWKNKDGATAPGGTTDKEQADNLREIVFYNDDGFDMHEGDVVSFMDDPQAFDFTYNGLETKEMTTLTFEFSKDKINECGCTGNCKINDDGDKLWLKISTSDGKFDGTNDGTRLYIALDGGTVGADATNTLDAGDIWVYDENDNCIREEQDGPTAAAGINFEYRPAGGDYGQLNVNTNNIDGANHDWAAITLTQDIGKVDSSDSYADTEFCADYDTTTGDLSLQHTCNDGGTGDDDPQADYTVASGTGAFADVQSLNDIVGKTVDDGFVDLRGTEYDLSNSKYQFDIPQSVRHMQFTFTTHGEEAEPNTETVVLHEGDTHTIGETTIEVVSIDGTANCGVSGTGATTCEYAGGITGVIKDEEGNTQTELTAIVPSDFSVSSLIKLDKDAMNDASFISVGGPKVNKVTARELTGANAVDFNTERVVVKQIAPGKIIVAGLTADDTLQAADQFINELKTLQ